MGFVFSSAAVGGTSLISGTNKFKSLKLMSFILCMTFFTSYPLAYLLLLLSVFYRVSSLNVELRKVLQIDVSPTPSTLGRRLEACSLEEENGSRGSPRH